MLEGSTYHRTELSRLFRYCSNQGINPDDLNDDISAAYLDALETEALVTSRGHAINLSAASGINVLTYIMRRAGPR